MIGNVGDDNDDDDDRVCMADLARWVSWGEQAVKQELNDCHLDKQAAAAAS